MKNEHSILIFQFSILNIQLSIKTYFTMKTVLAITLILAMICCKRKGKYDIPSCISDKIIEMQTAPITNPESTVYEYVYNGQKVYYIPPTCCDFPSQLYDENCNLLCRPDGGKSGLENNRCKDFFEKRTNEKLIWKDERD
jgi:hypothetical protein